MGTLNSQEAKMALKYFLFDLDGVLINACDWHYECLNKAMDQVVESPSASMITTQNSMDCHHKLN